MVMLCLTANQNANFNISFRWHWKGERKMYNMELHNLIKPRNDELDGICSTHGLDEKSIQYFSCERQERKPRRNDNKNV